MSKLWINICASRARRATGICNACSVKVVFIAVKDTRFAPSPQAAFQASAPPSASNANVAPVPSPVPSKSSATRDPNYCLSKRVEWKVDPHAD